MKIKFYMAAMLAVALMSCKNEAKTDTNGKADTTKGAAATGDTPAENAGEPAGEASADAVPAEGQILLRLNYPKGFEQQLIYNVNTTGEGMKAKVGMTMSVKVVSVKEGTAPVYGFQSAITGMKMDSEAMGQKIVYDSSKKAAVMSEQEKMMDKQLKEVLNQPITFSLDSKGALQGKMQFKNKSGENQEQPFDVNNYQIAFPDKPVGVGSVWTKDVKNEQMGGTVKNTYTVKEITDDTVVVALESVIPPVPGTDKKTTLTGSYTLDRTTGMVLKGNIKGKMATMGATIDMTFTGKRVK
ncbi:MAG: hypothetical protein EOP54_14735 [Sphingobacteriales bacterium]|nr:MAG: hypothetical protein EOP54_14735 [Sphingobacteriales bacterium]